MSLTLAPVAFFQANIFDFIIVMVSYAIELFHFHSDISWLRVFRVLRLLRLIQRAKGLKVLVQTLLYALPSLTNVVLLLTLIFFIYAILGMGLFGGIPHNESPNSFINAHCNFDNFVNSIITLFRMATVCSPSNHILRFHCHIDAGRVLEWHYASTASRTM